MGQTQPPRREMGLLVRRQRLEMGYSQRDLARMTGMRQARISEIERGLVRPSHTEQERLAKHLGLNPIAAFLAWLGVELPPGYVIVKEERDAEQP